uniref:Uncharacterized protein n=1 Tax=Larimichthys crocea TaxID=215358 RepID=A0A0F8AW80_LARCR
MAAARATTLRVYIHVSNSRPVVRGGAVNSYDFLTPGAVCSLITMRDCCLTQRRKISYGAPILLKSMTKAYWT